MIHDPPRHSLHFDSELIRLETQITISDEEGNSHTVSGRQVSCDSLMTFLADLPFYGNNRFYVKTPILAVAMDCATQERTATPQRDLMKGVRN